MIFTYSFLAISFHLRVKSFHQFIFDTFVKVSFLVIPAYAGISLPA